MPLSVRIRGENGVGLTVFPALRLLLCFFIAGEAFEHLRQRLKLGNRRCRTEAPASERDQCYNRRSPRCLAGTLGKLVLDLPPSIANEFTNLCPGLAPISRDCVNRRLFGGGFGYSRWGYGGGIGIGGILLIVLVVYLCWSDTEACNLPASRRVSSPRDSTPVVAAADLEGEIRAPAVAP
jgi:hypothetical protein